MAALGFFAAGCFVFALAADVSVIAVGLPALPVCGAAFACGFALSVFAVFATAFRDGCRRCATFLAGFAAGLGFSTTVTGSAIFVVATNCFVGGFNGCGPNGLPVFST